MKEYVFICNCTSPKANNETSYNYVIKKINSEVQFMNSKAAFPFLGFAALNNMEPKRAAYRTEYCTLQFALEFWMA